MEILLTIVILLLLALCGGLGYLMWVTLKPKKEVTPEKVFDDFKKMYDDSDPKAKERLEQMSKCIFYSSELEDKGIFNGN